MRIERRGDCIHVCLKSIRGFLLIVQLDAVIEAPQQLALDIFAFVARILHAQVLILQLFTPQLFQTGLIGRPRCGLAALEFQRLGCGEIEFRGSQHALHVRHLLSGPLQKLIVDGEPSCGIAGDEIVIEMNADLLPELFDLGSGEVAAIVVEIVEVTVEYLLRERVVDRHLAVMVLQQVLGNRATSLLLIDRWLELYRLRPFAGGSHRVIPGDRENQQKKQSRIECLMYLFHTIPVKRG